MTTFFWSDLHLNHAGIIRYCSRPYGSVEEMNLALTHRWNTVVGPTDTVWVLGDFGFNRRPEMKDRHEPGALFDSLNGKKCLVVGNHDERNPKVLRLPWERVERLFTFKEDGRRAELCHYPLETWKSAHHGALMLHGHSHGTLRRTLPHRFDVGADVEVAPVSFQELLKRADAQTFEATDHHGEDL